MLAKNNKFMKEAILIGGEWVEADGGETIQVTNPATGQLIGTVPKAGKAETRRAIDVAADSLRLSRKPATRPRGNATQHARCHDGQSGQAGLSC